MKTSFVKILAVALLTLGTFTRCGNTASLLGAGSPLISALTGAGNLGTMASVLQTPGLGKLLGGSLKNPFTLLAPRDDAFAALGQAALGSLTKPENIGTLAGVLGKHIVPGKLDAAAIAKGGLMTAAGTGLNLGGANLGNLITGNAFNIIPIDKVLP